MEDGEWDTFFHGFTEYRDEYQIFGREYGRDEDKAFSAVYRGMLLPGSTDTPSPGMTVDPGYCNCPPDPGEGDEAATNFPEVEDGWEKEGMCVAW